MRTLHAAILIVMLSVLALSFLVFRSISGQMEKAYFNPVFEKTDRLELEAARSALQFIARFPQVRAGGRRRTVIAHRGGRSRD